MGRADTKWVAYKDLGPFVVSLARDQQQNLWIGTEDQGVYRLNTVSNELEQFVSPETFSRQKGKAGLAPGLGDDNGYALACDKLGRVWVGHLNHGVSVFNGKDWKTYDVLNGPLGERIFKIAICPTDGDVWMATSAGLARYSESVAARAEGGSPRSTPAATGIWRYYTRAEGLPSDQINSLAFDAKGNLVVGTQCDGIAIASAANDYKTWAVVGRVTARGEGDTLPLTPRGSGLPTNLINEVLVTHDGTIYAATTTGLAWSFDSGKTWSYLRGHDYADKVRGLWGGAPKGWKEAEKEGMDSLLPEDYITCLAEDENGNLLLGFRQQGLALVSPPRSADARSGVGRVTDAANPNRVVPNVPPRVYVNKPKDKSVVGGEKVNLPLPTVLSHWSKSEKMPDEYVKTILTSADGNHAIGFYGGGVIQFVASEKENPPASAIRTPPSSFPPLPAPAHPSTLTELQAMQKVVKLQPTAPTTAAYLGEDWLTQGDWVGRYGRQYAMLCAVASPADHILSWDERFVVNGDIGPNCQKGDGLRHWIHWAKTDNPRTLYDPVYGYRRQAEWDDHGEAYPLTVEGTDLLVTVTVPEGIYRLSLYFFNKDGHEGMNRVRDYVVQIMPYNADRAAVIHAIPLAQARVCNFWGGVFKQFVLAGPSKYSIKISRNYTFNTICSAILLDRLAGKPGEYDDSWLPYMEYVKYRPPVEPNITTANSSTIKAASALCGELNNAFNNKFSIEMQRYYRVAAYRSAEMDQASTDLLGAWRWRIPWMNENDHSEFRVVMGRALKVRQEMTGLNISVNPGQLEKGKK